MFYSKRGLGVGIATLGLLLVGQGARAQITYSILDLGVLSGDSSSFAYGINNSSQVVGISQNTSGETHGFVYSGGTMTNIGSLGGDTYANAINGSGQVAGSAFSSTDGAFRAFRTAAGGTINATANLGSLPSGSGLDSVGYGINASGQTVGYSFAGTGNHAYRTTATGGVDAASDLGTLGGPNSVATGINTSGQVSGYSDTTPDINGNSVTHAFRTSAAGTMTDLGTLGGSNSYALALNDAGQVIGYSDLADGSQHAFRTSANQAIDPTTDDLGTLGGIFSYAYGINGSGITVGYSTTANGDQRAFVVQTTTMLDLTGLLTNNVAGWVLTEARGINTQGQIVGSGIVNGSQHAFILTPTGPAGTPEPGALALLIVSTGSGLLLARKKIVRTKKDRNSGRIEGEG